jgi:4-hydroxy-tetrahydrodipicolinate synthase
MSKLHLQGIVPPLVTPLLDRDRLDQAGTQRLIEHLITGGVHGVFILGTTGEAPSLSYRLRREFIRLVCGIVNDRLPVLVGITDTAFVESVELAKVAEAAGATAVVLSTPYYFPAGQTELLQYVRHIIDQLPLPLVLYNMPSLTKVWFEIETLRELSQFGEIVAVKDSSGDMEYHAQLMALKSARPDWSILMGPEHLLVESMRIGGDGGVCGGANIFPSLFSGLYTALVNGDQSEIDRRLDLVHELQEIYGIGKYGSRFIKATKSALSILGICSDHMAEPFNHFLPPERARVAAIVQQLTNSSEAAIRLE